MKRISILLALLITVAVGSQAYSLQSDGVYYNIIRAGVLEVTHGEVPYSGFVNVPDEVQANGKTYTVEQVGSHAFSACTGLTSLRLPDAVQSIGESAFAFCTGLHVVQLPAQLRQIGNAAFSGCSSLVSVRFPASVTNIGKDAFVGCARLERFLIDEGNTAFSVDGGVLFNSAATQLVAFPAAKSEQYSVPATVESIADGAFSHCAQLVSVTLPTSLRRIGSAAFYGCERLRQCTLPAGLTHIGVWAFSECASLTSVHVPASVVSIGDDAFSFCSALTAINVDAQNAQYASADGVLFDKSLSTILAFPGGKGPAYSVPSSVARIDNHAFYGCRALESVTLPATVSTIENNPFLFCQSLTDINVAPGNTNYSSADGVLYNKVQTAIVTVPKGREGQYNVPATVNRIPTGAFLCNEKLEAVSLPQGITSISDWAFLGCYGLSTLNLPASLQTIGEGALSDCVSLQEIICAGSPVATTPFNTLITGQARLFVPRGSLNNYLTATGWQDFSQVEEYGIYADPLKLNRGRLQNVPLRMDGSLPLTALQLSVQLPAGLRVAQDADGQYMVRLAGENALTHEASCARMQDGSYSLVVMSMQNQVLAPADTLLFIGVDIDDESALGNYPMLVNDIILTYMTDRHYGEAMQTAFQTDLAVGRNMGDVNHDGLVNVADVVVVLRYVHGQNPADFHFDEADVNQSGAVTVSDAVGIIDIIQAANGYATPGILSASQASTADVLSTDDLQIFQGKTATLDIELDNATTGYTAQQFDLTLPYGVTIAHNSRGGYDCQLSDRYQSHSVTVTPIADSYYEGNTYRIVCSSNSLSTIIGNSGLLLSLTLEAEEGLPNSEHIARLHHIVFADKEARAHELANAPFTLTIGKKTGIDDILLDASSPTSRQKGIYDLQGRRIQNDNRPLGKGIYIIDGRKVVVRK